MNSELQNGVIETEVMAIQKSMELDHSKLDNLDYEHSRHTGFQPAGNYIEDSNYVHTDNNYTTEEKAKLSNLENYDDTEIKADINSLEGIETIQNEEIVNIKATLSNKADKSEISGKQDLITSTNKLSSDLVDDTNKTNKFVTSSEKEFWNNKSDFSGDYNDLTNKPTIPVVPTNISSFTNDSNYQNATQVQTAINNAIGRALGGSY